MAPYDVFDTSQDQDSNLTPEALAVIRKAMIGDRDANVQGYRYYPPQQMRQMNEAQSISDVVPRGPASVDPYYDPLAASAGIAPAGPTPYGTAALRHGIDVVSSPGRMLSEKSPTLGEIWSDEDEARRQLNAAGQYNWGPEVGQAVVTSGMPVGLTEEAAGALGVAGGRALARKPVYDIADTFAENPNAGRGTVGNRGVEQAPGAAAPAVPERQSTDYAIGQAERVAGERRPLEGLPQQVIQTPDGPYVPGPSEHIHRLAEQYMQDAGLPYNTPKTYAKVDPERAKAIAQAFDEMPHSPNDPATKASYDAMIKETLAQYRSLKDQGFKLEFIKPGMEDPYKSNPRMAAKDFTENNHLWVFPTESGFGTQTKISDNPLLQKVPEMISGKQATANDIFRAVHDIYGHFKEGVGFRADGEENAWRSHSAMYSDLARPAMTTETRGQNSWVNYGPHGEKNRTASAADTTYADQKIGLLPDWAVNEGRHDFAGSMNPLENKPFTYKGKNPNEWTPEEYKEVGDKYGVKNLGPETPGQQFKYTNGETFNVPGGTDGKFTYYDMLRLKAEGIDPSRIDRDLHSKIQQKILRSVTPDELSNARVWDGLVFGMTSPNNPLFPNQISQSRLRLRDPQMLDQLSSMIPWKAGENAPKALRKQYSDKIANAFGLDAASKGGLGSRGSMDYTRIAELAQMFKKNPDFFRKSADEPWSNFVERLSSQVPGLSMKTGSFGSVWQEPGTAAISAIDRHMANEFEKSGGLFKDANDRAAWEQRTVDRFNKANPKRLVKDFQELRQTSGSDSVIGKTLLEYVGQTKNSKFRSKGGDINKNVPEHLKSADWVVEPKQVNQMGAAYRRALDINDQIAQQHGLNLFGSQWMEWDRIRHRMEPHENMFPGLENLPAMSKEQLRDVSAEHTASGHKNYAKVDDQGRLVRNVPKEERGGTYQLQPTKQRPNPARFGYFAIPPAAIAGAVAARQQNDQ